MHNFCSSVYLTQKLIFWYTISLLESIVEKICLQSGSWFGRFDPNVSLYSDKTSGAGSAWQNLSNPFCHSALFKIIVSVAFW